MIRRIIAKKVVKKLASKGARSSAQKAALKKAVLASAKARAKQGGLVGRTLRKAGKAWDTPRRLYGESVRKRTTNRLFKQSRATALNQSKAQANTLRTFQMQQQGKASNASLAKAFKNLDKANTRSTKFIESTGVLGGTVNRATGQKGLITAPFTTKAMVDRQLKKTKNRDFAAAMAFAATGGLTFGMVKGNPFDKKRKPKVALASKEKKKKLVQQQIKKLSNKK